MKMLIIEDDPFYAQRILEHLQDQQMEALVLSSAEEALQTDLTNCSGAVLDLMLPNDPQKTGITFEESRGGFRTGICVARRLLAKKADLKLVFLTSGIDPDAEAWAAERAIPFISKDQGYHSLLQVLRQLGLVVGERRPLAFIVHGHDEAALLGLKNYLQNTLKWQEPVVLREQQTGGKTIIEKFEEFARTVDCVFVLLTPDDLGNLPGTNDEKRRSRQNVIFEAGFFYGKMNRRSGRILLLHKGPNELPSDISGVVWIDISNGIEAAGEEIRREVSCLK